MNQIAFDRTGSRHLGSWSAKIFAASLIALASCPGAVASDKPRAFATEFDERGGGGSWEVSHDWSNGEHQACKWSRSRVRLEGGKARVEAVTASDGQTVTCGEVRSRRRFGFGLFEARLQAPSASGMLGSFFLYAPPGKDVAANEIDVQFPGQSDTIQLNHSGFGYTGAEEVFDLDGPREQQRIYSVLWEPGRIVWFVDGEVVHSKAGEILPTRPMQVFFTVWASEQLAAWLGPLERTQTPATLLVESFSYIPLEDVCGRRADLCEAARAEGVSKTPKD